MAIILAEFNPLYIDNVWVRNYNVVPRLPDQEEPHLYTCGDVHKILDFDLDVMLVYLFWEKRMCFVYGRRETLIWDQKTVVDCIIFPKYSLLPCGRVLPPYIIYIRFGRITWFGKENMSRHQKPFMVLPSSPTPLATSENGFIISLCLRTKKICNSLDRELWRICNMIKKQTFVCVRS